MVRSESRRLKRRTTRKTRTRRSIDTPGSSSKKMATIERKTTTKSSRFQASHQKASNQLPAARPQPRHHVRTGVWRGGAGGQGKLCGGRKTGCAGRQVRVRLVCGSDVPSMLIESWRSRDGGGGRNPYGKASARVS